MHVTNPIDEFQGQPRPYHMVRDREAVTSYTKNDQFSLMHYHTHHLEVAAQAGSNSNTKVATPGIKSRTF